MAGQPVGGRRRGQPVAVLLEGVEESIDPLALAPAVLPGRRPRPELLAVVAHHPDPAAVLGGVLAEIVDDLLDVPERDPIAQALLCPEDAQELALVLGRVRTPQVLLGDRGGTEVGVVEDRPVVAGRDQRCREVRFPDTFGQPGTDRAHAEQRLELLAHPPRLTDPITLRERGEDRFVVATADDLDLAARHERREAGDEFRPLRAEPFQQRPGVVEREPDVGMALERGDHRLVGEVVDLGHHPSEVADRLVVVDRERQRDARCHLLARSAGVRADRRGLRVQGRLFGRCRCHGRIGELFVAPCRLGRHVTGGRIAAGR